MHSQYGLHKIFEDKSREFPDNIAVSDDHVSLTYSELNVKANRLVKKLVKAGISNGSIVGICTGRNVEFVVGILAILKCGGAYLPIDPTYPIERISYVINDSSIRYVLTDKAFRNFFANNAMSPIDISDTEPNATDDLAKDLDFNTTNTAYVLYTSGTSGAAKGVMVEHRNVIQLFSQVDRFLNFSHDDKWSVFHSFSFDFSVWEIWGALLYGGEAVIIPFNISRSPEKLLELLHRKNVTLLSQTPSAFTALTAKVSGVDKDRLNLRSVILGGEALDLSIAKRWMDNFGDRPKIINMYGITETTVHVTYKEINRKDLDLSNISPIGNPLPDMKVFLLDENGKEVRETKVGEMYVAGTGLSRGYLNRPELTAERFVTLSIRNVTERAYRSGDLSSRNSSGELEYRGRADSQIKINGFRIEPGEIEAVTKTSSLVADSAVVLMPTKNNSSILVNYVVPAKGLKGENLDNLGEKITTILQLALPAYMIPQECIIIDALPRTVNDKVDRKALIARALPTKMVNVKISSHENIEHKVRDIWKSVLSIDDSILVDEDFFDIGGNSLSLVRLISKINGDFGVSVEIAALLDGVTIQSFTNEIKSRLQEKSGMAIA